MADKHSKKDKEVIKDLEEIKKEIKKEKTKKPEKTEKEQERQMIYIFIFMAITLLAVFGFSYFYKTAGNFKYDNLYFEKTKYGELTVYLTKIMVTNQYGKIEYKMYLRNDPRKLKMPIDASINLKQNVIISFDPEISKCYASNLASYELGSLLGGMGYSVKGATASKQLAQEQNLVFADCSTAIDNTVILIKTIDGNQSSVTQQGNCYEINVANCQALETTEKFMIGLVNQIINKGQQ